MTRVDAKLHDRISAAVAPAPDPYASQLGDDLTNLPENARAKAWRQVQREAPEFARILKDFEAIFGKPAALYFTTSPESAAAAEAATTARSRA